MDIQRRGTEFYIDLDKKEDVQGLYAVIHSRPDLVSKEVYERGMQIYGWFFEQINILNQQYEAEAAIPYRKRDKKGKSK